MNEIALIVSLKGSLVIIQYNGFVVKKRFYRSDISPLVWVGIRDLGSHHEVVQSNLILKKIEFRDPFELNSPFITNSFQSRQLSLLCTTFRLVIGNAFSSDPSKGTLSRVSLGWISLQTMSKIKSKN